MKLKLPPQDIDAEKSVLGALMIDKNAIIRVADLLTEEDFYSPQHQKIYRAIIEIFEKVQPVDILTVTNKLKDKNQLSEIGGSSYLSDLINFVPSSAHIAHYAQLIRQKKVLRDLLITASQITEEVFENGDSTENLLDKIEQKIFSIDQQAKNPSFTLIKDHLQEAYERIEKIHHGESEFRGVPSGFDDLDHYLSGFQKSDLIILGARPSMGKTSFALDIARNAAKKGASVGVFSLEMAKEQIIDRFIAAEAHVPLWRLRTGRLTDDMDFEMIQSALDRLSRLPIYIDDTPSPNILQLRSMARRLQMEHSLNLLVIDYVQLINPVRHSENVVQQYTEISHGLKALAREMNIPVLALSQLNRAVDSREIKIPRLSDLRETGCLNKDALIYNPINGTRIPIAELANNLKGENILSINENWLSVSQPITKAFSSGKKEIFELTTRTGRKIKASANHPFRKLDGWTRLDKLKMKDRIAVARYLPEPIEQVEIENPKLIILAHLIGDGCYLKRQPLHYTNNDAKCLEIVAQSAKVSFGINAKWIKQKNWHHIYLTEKNRAKNKLIEWLKELEIYNQHSGDKNIPEVIFKLSNAKLALFIKHLWATDGTIYFNKSSNNWAINYTSKSQRLIDDLQTLMLRFGLVTTIRTHSKKNYEPTFSLEVQGAEMQLKFFKEIGIFGRKNELAQEALNQLEELTPNPNLDVIPKEIWKIIGGEKNKLGIGWREFSKRLGMQYCGSTLFKRSPSRSTLTKISTQCLENNVSLLELANSSVYWDEVKSIKSLGIEEVFDLSVSETHNFLANNIYVHNSWEQDADVVMFIYRPDRDKVNPTIDEQNTAQVIIQKHRNGPLGTINLKFNQENVSFQQIDKKHTDENS